MSWRIRSYEGTDAHACAALYNQVFQVVPTFVPVDADSMCRGLREPDSVHAEVTTPSTLVGLDGGGELAGFVAYCHRRHSASEPWHGVVRLLCCDPAHPDHPDLAAALITAVRAELSSAAVEELRFDGTGGVRFLNGGVSGLPSSLASLAPAMLDSGLRLTGNDLVFAGRTRRALRPTSPAVLEPAGSADPVSCRAFVDGEPVGECWVASHRAWNSHPDATKVAQVQWIVVDERWRGQGIGRQLLGYVHEQLADLGVERVSLITAYDNLPAQSLYYASGLAPVDQLLAFRSG